MKPAPMPWIVCGPFWPRRTAPGERPARRRSTCTPGLRSLSTSPTPVMVPPVPTPATKMSTWPSVSPQISSAVVSRWISGLAGFLNCCGMKYFGSLGGELLGLRDRAGHALGPGREDQLGAEPRSSGRRSRLMVSGMVSTSLYAARGAHHGQGDAGVAAGRLDDDGVRPDQPGRLGGVDHRHADAVLDAVGRVEVLQLGHDLGAGAVGDPPEPDQRRVADQLGDVIRDAHVVDPSTIGAAQRQIGWPHAIVHTAPMSDRRPPAQQRALAAVQAAGLDYRIGAARPGQQPGRGRCGARSRSRTSSRRSSCDAADDDYLFVLVPGIATISWPKLRALLGVSRLSMPDAATALAATGYERGTITAVRLHHGLARRRRRAHARPRGRLGAGAHGVADRGRPTRRSPHSARPSRTSPIRSSGATASPPDSGPDSRLTARANALTPSRPPAADRHRRPTGDRLRRPLDVTVPASVDRLDLRSPPARASQEASAPDGCSDSAERRPPAPDAGRRGHDTSDEAAGALHSVDHDKGRNRRARGGSPAVSHAPAAAPAECPDDHHRTGREVRHRRLAHAVQVGGVVGWSATTANPARDEESWPHRHACRRQQAEVRRRPGGIRGAARPCRSPCRAGRPEVRHRAEYGTPAQLASASQAA